MEVKQETTPLDYCFENLRLIIDLARKKINAETLSATEKQRWARIMVGAISCYGRLMEGKELSEVLDLLESRHGGEQLRQNTDA